MMRLFVLSAVVLAHSWYPSACCSGSDCHEVPCDEITEVPRGYMWEGLLFSPDKVQPSQDRHCHACAGLVNAKPYTPRCLFVIPST